MGIRLGRRGVFSIEDSTLSAINCEMVRVLKNSTLVPIKRLRFDSCQGLEFAFNRWARFYADDFPIVFVTAHGGPASLGSEAAAETLSLEVIASTLSEFPLPKAHIHFSSCATLDARKNRLDSFLLRSGLLGVSGFRRNVYPIETLGMDYLLLSQLSTQVLSSKRIIAACEWVNTAFGTRAGDAGFGYLVAGSAHCP